MRMGCETISDRLMSPLNKGRLPSQPENPFPGHLSTVQIPDAQRPVLWHFQGQVVASQQRCVNLSCNHDLKYAQEQRCPA